MEKKNLLIKIVLPVLFSTFVIMYCEKRDSQNVRDTEISLKSGELSEKMQILQSMDIQQMTTNAMALSSPTLTYSNTLCPDEQINDEVAAFTITSPDLWNYYTFYGIEGSTIYINLVRVDCQMDAAYSLFFGRSATPEGIHHNSSTNENLTFIAFRDDDVNRPEFCSGTCFAYWDPNPVIVLPNTG